MSETELRPDLPDGVGPHEFRELELMLAGAKPLAMFFDVIPATIELPESDFRPFVESGRIILREEIYHPTGSGEPPLRYLYFSLVGEEHRIDSLHRLNREIIVEGRQTSPDDHILTGQLLGYEEWEIEVFLRRINGKLDTVAQKGRSK